MLPLTASFIALCSNQLDPQTMKIDSGENLSTKEAISYKEQLPN
jgi:hypothetical protein